jgi:hypothetical protein
VLALGTNDAADVYVGSSIGDAQRIREMMSTIGDQPVMWVNVRTLNRTGPYAESNMQGWNRALLRACARYPNMRVFDWASVARRRWFIPDGMRWRRRSPPAGRHRRRAWSTWRRSRSRCSASGTEPADALRPAPAGPGCARARRAWAPACRASGRSRAALRMVCP